MTGLELLPRCWLHPQTTNPSNESPTHTPRRVAILGVTGSVGTSALNVAIQLKDQIQVVGVTAHSKLDELAKICHQIHPRIAVVTSQTAYETVDRSLFPPSTTVMGPEGLFDLVTSKDVDIVLTAMVGAAGLHGTWAAVEAGKNIALANKETMIVAGPLIKALAAKTGSQILPVDSEHSAIFQALGRTPTHEVAKVILTASGGPFRDATAEKLKTVTPSEALRHPTWSMGPKITIDSATLMNKALEVIEARWLFDLEVNKIDVLVHPESYVHSFVEFVDGSVLAQLSPPDMQLPIQYALTYPHRIPGPARKVDWNTFKQLNFEPPNRELFPALDLGFEVANKAGTCGAVLNAANEAAVARFLSHDLAFTNIAHCCRAVLSSHNYESSPTLDGLWAQDRWARQEVARWTR